MYCIHRSKLIVTIITIFLSYFSTAWSQQIESDHSKILVEHKRIIDAHMMRDVEGMLEGAVDDYVLVNRGEVNNPTVDERRQRFSHYFKITVFSEYKDLIPPVIHISDDGKGVSPEDRDKIFEALYSTKNFGVGLGLPIMKQIMEQHHGGITIDSPPDGGANVVLWLPLDKQAGD